MTISAEIAGFAPALLAGGSVTLTGLRPELNGAWHVTSARHRLGQGLTTTFEARKGQVK
ncbi:hypothetical protein [Phaeovulum veldkampii]|uniref:hypothetical protein n=1 Tax=Phaeovulum veldkampii TaxID=33049 RepID=UPI001F3D8231|nr:hypothetical protein [Phaeovulum veldkampii]